MNSTTVVEMLMSEGFKEAEPWGRQVHLLHEAIGDLYIAARRTGSGTNIEYTNLDVRRAIAFLRLRKTIGRSGTSYAQHLFDAIRDVAQRHDHGYVVVSADGLTWAATVDEHASMEALNRGEVIVVIPCYIEALGDANYGTVALSDEVE